LSIVISGSDKAKKLLKEGTYSYRGKKPDGTHKYITYSKVADTKRESHSVSFLRFLLLLKFIDRGKGGF
jgi:hypothetical protein